MADVTEKQQPNVVLSENFPVTYANSASVTTSYHDIRVYFSDVFPKELVTDQHVGPVKVKESLFAPRICIAMSPEFAKAVRDALDRTLSQYEAQFGPLRTSPQTQPTQPK